MTDLDLAFTPAVELVRRIAAGELSPAELIANSLARIADVNAALNCFCFVWDEEATAAAVAAADAVVRGQELGPLHGLPVALKDTTPTAGRTTTLGSYSHEHWVPERDAYIVGALRRAGAIVMGKTTSPEFAHSSVTDSPLWGPTRNPWNPERSSGGSSGGSAAAVATGCVAVADGSDMGGSVRIPAAWCGIVGLKPGLGRIPMDTLPGLFDLISHLGPLARDVDDARLYLSAVQGPDDSDILSIPCPLDLTGPTPASVEGLRCGLSIDLGCWEVELSVEAAVRDAAAALEAAGAVVDEVEPGITPGDEHVWEQLWGVFMAAYYGDVVEAHGERMDKGVLALIERGSAMSAVELKRLEIARTDLWRRMARILADHDVLLCPTMSGGPPPARKRDWQALPRRPGSGYLALDMTAPFNLLAPCPALSVPCGWDAEGMPVGLQIVGRRWREDVVLRVGRAVELALPQARRRPPELRSGAARRPGVA